MKPSPKLDETLDGPTADTEDETALCIERPWQRTKRHDDAVVELTVVRPAEGEAIARRRLKDRFGQLGIDSSFQSNMRCAKAPEITGDNCGASNGYRGEARWAVGRNHDQGFCRDARQHAIELMHGPGGGANALRLVAANLRQQDRRMPNERAGYDARHGIQARAVAGSGRKALIASR